MADDNFKDSVDKLESQKELPEGPETKELPQHEETISGALPPADEQEAATAAPMAAAGNVNATTDAQEASGVMKTGVWAVVALAVVALGALLYYGSRTGLKHHYNPRVAQAEEIATDPEFGSDGLYYYQASANEPDASGIMKGKPVAAKAFKTSASTPTNINQYGAPQVVVVYLFGYDKAGVPENADLNNVAKEAVSGSRNVIIKAYTDEHGTSAYNQKLSDRRAKAIGDYMVKHGVPANNVKTKGMGPTHAFAGGDAQNRRAEISLSK